MLRVPLSTDPKDPNAKGTKDRANDVVFKAPGTIWGVCRETKRKQPCWWVPYFATYQMAGPSGKFLVVFKAPSNPQ